MRGFMTALQLWAAFFLTIFGLALAFHETTGGALLFGSLLAAVGLTFLALLAINVRKPR
ncbi:MAG: hypothetical protein ACM3SW_00335 [Actinomycetota bacterium]